MESSTRPALRMVLRYASPSAGPIVDVVSLRQRGLVLRHTNYHQVVVNERLLTRSFPFVLTPSRRIAVVMLGGALDIVERDATVRVTGGEAVLLGGASMPRTRWTSANYLDLEWTVPSSTTHALPGRLGSPDPTRVRELAAALADESCSQRTTLTLGLALFASIGAPVDASLAVLCDEPSERDRRLALAMEEQLAHLASRATTVHLGDSAMLSPRQLQRVVSDFNLRYGINAGNWRDTRNRWRVQIAAVLLSIADLTVADIAREVGYGSPNGLARAFAHAGFPSPAEVRQALSEKDPLCV